MGECTDGGGRLKNHRFFVFGAEGEEPTEPGLGGKTKNHWFLSLRPPPAISSIIISSKLLRSNLNNAGK